MCVSTVSQVLLKERQWNELPSDILLKIFEKMDPFNILTKVIRLCRDWFKVARNDPILWRKVVDMTCHGDKFGPNYIEDMACVAVNWSAGQLEEFSAAKFGINALLQYIASRYSNLKCITLIKSPVSRKTLKKVIKRWPLIEEIELTEYECTPALCQAIGQCPRLKCFRLNKFYLGGRSTEMNWIANSIGITMPNLHSLQLIGSWMTNEGLRTILKGCPQLESLDIRKCWALSIDQSIMSELERIKELFGCIGNKDVPGRANSRKNKPIQTQEKEGRRSYSLNCFFQQILGRRISEEIQPIKYHSFPFTCKDGAQ